MKVLIVCSGTQGILSPFIKDQMDAISKFGIKLSLFQINKKGFYGYLMHLKSLKKAIKQIKPDLIHAHYGLSGLLANMQLSVPVATTFHGSDINNAHELRYSKWACRLSAASIFVENNMMQKVKKYDKNILIPCGVDTSVFYPISKLEASKILGINSDITNILFSSAFGNPVKNYPLAKEACKIVETRTGRIINLIELKGYTREQVNLLMNASDCVLLTSFSEGSPQFIKEATSCNTPIVSTDVGDVNQLIGTTEGCYITSYDPNVVAQNIIYALKYANKNGKTNNRDRIFEKGLDSLTIAKRIIEVYNKILEKK